MRNVRQQNNNHNENNEAASIAKSNGLFDISDAAYLLLSALEKSAKEIIEIFQTHIWSKGVGQCSIGTKLKGWPLFTAWGKINIFLVN